MNIDYTAVAEAMGMYTKYNPVCSNIPCPVWINAEGATVVRDGYLEGYFNSPEGREAVRDKVRELWCQYVTLPLGTGDYNKLLYSYSCKAHTVTLKRHSTDSRDAPSFSAGTSHEAYCAAVIWLAERGEK